MQPVLEVKKNLFKKIHDAMQAARQAGDMGLHRLLSSLEEQVQFIEDQFRISEQTLKKYAEDIELQLQLEVASAIEREREHMDIERGLRNEIEALKQRELSNREAVVRSAKSAPRERERAMVEEHIHDDVEVLNSKQSEISELVAQLAEAKEATRTVQSAMDALRLNQDVGRKVLEMELDEVKRKCEQLEQARKSGALTLQSEVDALRSELKQLRAAEAVHKLQAELQGEVALKLQAELQALKSEAAVKLQAEAQQDATRRDREAVEARADLDRAERDVALGDVARLQARVHVLQEELGTRCDTEAGLRLQLEALREESAAAAGKLRDERDEVISSMAQLQAVADGLRSEMHKLRDIEEELRAKLETQTEIISRERMEALTNIEKLQSVADRQHAELVGGLVDIQQRELQLTALQVSFLSTVYVFRVPVFQRNKQPPDWGGGKRELQV